MTKKEHQKSTASTGNRITKTTATGIRTKVIKTASTTTITNTASIF